jgi:hypothetical protein
MNDEERITMPINPEKWRSNVQNNAELKQKAEALMAAFRALHDRLDPVLGAKAAEEWLEKLEQVASNPRSRVELSEFVAALIAYKQAEAQIAVVTQE